MPDLIKSLFRLVLGALVVWVVARMFLAVVGASVLAETLGMIALERAVLPTLLAVLIPVAVFEVAVVASAVLDWREARLSVATRQQAWAAAHVTVFVRSWRRCVWVTQGLKVTWKLHQEARALASRSQPEYVVVDPTQPFDGRVIEVVDDREERAS